ncbi:MAG TPA: MBL fold metallo-hydrolase, partial [Longimicrobiaceae bacterium]|nr:MBL fold metallo-hydrolase [Longimicrobiaceae bacterium]
TAWAVPTSEGIVVIDPLFDYSVEAAVVEGLTKLGFDPSDIKYVIVSHGHSDHAAGARLLQERFGARVVASAADWDLMERNTASWPKPQRDIVITGDRELRIGDTTFFLVNTPGHTPGTISTLLPLKDGPDTHLGVLWGGTGFNFTASPEYPRAFWYRAYINSAERLREMARWAGADVILSNHPASDGTATKLPAVSRRQSGDPHPYVVGSAAVGEFLTVAAECAKASLLNEG